MMFEKLRTHETMRSFKRHIENSLGTLGLIDVEETAQTPEPYSAIINGYSWNFKDENTHLVRCEENPTYSCIVQIVTAGKDEIVSHHCLYGQPEIMDDMERLGFGVVEEGVEEAETNYMYFHESAPQLGSIKPSELN